MPLLDVRHVQRPFEEQVQTHSKNATFEMRQLFRSLVLSVDVLQCLHCQRCYHHRNITGSCRGRLALFPYSFDPIVSFSFRSVPIFLDDILSNSQFYIESADYFAVGTECHFYHCIAASSIHMFQCFDIYSRCCCCRAAAQKWVYIATARIAGPLVTPNIISLVQCVNSSERSPVLSANCPIFVFIISFSCSFRTASVFESFVYISRCSISRLRVKIS